MPDLSNFEHLAIAAAIGFLIGFQREWHHAEEAKERAFAGARTFALIGFVGGLAGLLGGDSPVLVAVGLAAIAGLTIAAYWAEARATPGTGGATEVALLRTYLLGILLLLGNLPASRRRASSQSFSLKPLFSIGPRIWRRGRSTPPVGIPCDFRHRSTAASRCGYGMINTAPSREIWQLVVLISGLSFAGYWLTKLYGVRGVLITGLVGGLASSTATTLSVSRFVREGAASARAGAAGVVAANLMMIGRIAVLLGVVGSNVLAIVWPALAAAAAVGAASVAVLWRGRSEQPSELKLGNPMELRPALFFAAFLGFVSVASRVGSAQFGAAGLYAVALVTGLADVDALTLTAGGQAHAGDLAANVAAIAVLLAAASNIVVKGAMTFAIAGRRAGLMVASAFALVLAAGTAGWFVASLA
ncbi:MAG: MgtC/SapB family protein [Parvularculaceae bacterium]